MSSHEITEYEIRDRCAMWLRHASQEAIRLRHGFIGTEHLYIALTHVSDGLAERLLHHQGLDPRQVRNEIRKAAGNHDTLSDADPDHLPLTPRLTRILKAALQLSNLEGIESVGEAHLLAALFHEGQGVAARVLISLGVSMTRWLQALEDESSPDESGALADSGYPVSIHAVSSSAYVAAESLTPLLDKFGRDLTQLAREGKIMSVVGREREIRQMARTLTRTKKNNPLLVGDAGVGKTAVVEGLAYKIVHGSVPPNLLNRRIVQLEIGTLVAGTSLRGQFEERLLGILEEAHAETGIILFIDEIHTIVGAGDTIDSNLDAANILKPALARGDIVCIGATTHEEYRAAIAKDPALDRRFRTIEIAEPSEADTLHILRHVHDEYAAHHGVQIHPDALSAAVTLSSKFLQQRRQPDKALDLLDEACARVALATVPNIEMPRVVTPESVAEVLAEWTGIPITQLNEDERRRYHRLEEVLQARVIGQDHAVALLAGAIRANRAGLSDPNRPIGVFMFLGPSGVGKTELAKALASFLFGSETSLLRFDMSEFHDEHTVARLIGSPPGYKDSQRGGQLTEALRRRPYSVILLDEVEKAAPQVFDVFLQAFDEGRLTDARGGTVDARHAVWIMTSNIGTATASRGSLGFQSETSAPNVGHYQAELRRFFRVEFLNRLDEIIVFSPLSQATLSAILDLNLHALHQRLAEQHISLQLSPEARDLLLSQGSDPQQGARPLRRTIERMLTRPLSQIILENNYPANTVLLTKVIGGKIQFEATQAVTAHNRTAMNPTRLSQSAPSEA